MNADSRNELLRSQLTNASDLVRRHWVTVLVGLVTAVYLVFSTLYRNDHGPLAPLSTVNGIRITLVTVFFILVVFARFPLYRTFSVFQAVIVPIAMGLVLVYFWKDPFGADGLAFEDRLIEDFSFLFLMAGAGAMMLAAIVLAKRREWLSAVTSVLGSAVFFVIGMEEISWFQRVLEIESSEFFLERNAQLETNFHNMYTHTSEHVYYIGAFILLAVMPYYRKEIGNFLDGLKLTSLRVILPPSWLIAPFIVAGAFVRGANRAVGEAPSMAVVVGSLVLMAGLIVRFSQSRAWLELGHIIATFVLFVLTFWFFASFDYASTEIRVWVPTEYHEFFIAWGIAAYGISVVFQVCRPKQERTGE